MATKGQGLEMSAPGLHFCTTGKNVHRHKVMPTELVHLISKEKHTLGTALRGHGYHSNKERQLLRRLVELTQKAFIADSGRWCYVGGQNGKEAWLFETGCSLRGRLGG